MARSKYIYLVTHPGKDVASGFTVKHEMMSWLDRQKNHENLCEWKVWRIRDYPYDFDNGVCLGYAHELLEEAE